MLRLTLLMLFSGLLSVGMTHAADYDPLTVPKDKSITKDFVVKDEKRNRELPLRVYLPATMQPAPVILFSHGLGGSKEASPYLGNHWSQRGYVAVFIQHPGSDEAVWKDVPLRERMAALQKAAGLDNFQLRVADVPAVLDQLTRWNKAAGHELAGRLNLEAIGMTGHSFGAVTTQSVSGQKFPIGRGFTDPRIKAACAMSPSPPRRGDVKQAFGGVTIPWLLLTGTKDGSPIGDIEPASRVLVYPALPVGGKYELVLDKAEHSAFGDRGLAGETERRNSNHHRAILATTTAFWDAYLEGNTAAKQWLDTPEQVRKVLETADRWQSK